MSRTLEQINTEYSQTAMLLGDKTYKKLLLETEINNLVVQANKLDTEASELKKKSVEPIESTTPIEVNAQDAVEVVD